MVDVTIVKLVYEATCNCVNPGLINLQFTNMTILVKTLDP